MLPVSLELQCLKITRVIWASKLSPTLPAGSVDVTSTAGVRTSLQGRATSESHANYDRSRHFFSPPTEATDIVDSQSTLEHWRVSAFDSRPRVPTLRHFLANPPISWHVVKAARPNNFSLTPLPLPPRVRRVVQVTVVRHLLLVYRHSLGRLAAPSLDTSHLLFRGHGLQPLALALLSLSLSLSLPLSLSIPLSLATPWSSFPAARFHLGSRPVSWPRQSQCSAAVNGTPGFGRGSGVAAG